jgi:hypothetical protein
MQWPGYRVYRHEIDEKNKTLDLWVRRKRGNRKLECPTSTVIKKATNVAVGSIWLGDFHRIGMCRRSCPTTSIFCGKEMKTVTPPKGVTARLVSRRLGRSLDSRAAISPDLTGPSQLNFGIQV